MKNVRLMIALFAALMIAAPAMALEVEVSGHYFVEHFNHSNSTLNKDEATDDYSTMEFMAKPVFNINDNITLTTQFTAKSMADARTVLRETWDGMHTDFESGQWEAKPQPLCGWCDAIEHCPEGLAATRLAYKKGRLKNTAPAYPIVAAL